MKNIILLLHQENRILSSMVVEKVPIDLEWVSKLIVFSVLEYRLLASEKNIVLFFPFF